MRYLLPLVFVIVGLYACGGDATTTDKTDKPADSITVAKTDSAAPLSDAGEDDNHSYKSPIKEPPANLQSFIPTGYLLMDTCTGDLNKDAYNDMLIVLCVKDEYKLSQE